MATDCVLCGPLGVLFGRRFLLTFELLAYWEKREREARFLGPLGALPLSAVGEASERIFWRGDGAVITCRAQLLGSRDCARDCGLRELAAESFLRICMFMVHTHTHTHGGAIVRQAKAASGRRKAPDGVFCGTPIQTGLARAERIEFHNLLTSWSLLY